MVLTSSRDGRTLAGVDSQGNVTLFEFATLRPMYRICFGTNILPKCLAFTANSLRFLEIRGDRVRVWEPTVLLRLGSREDENNDARAVSNVRLGIE